MARLFSAVCPKHESGKSPALDDDWSSRWQPKEDCFGSRLPRKRPPIINLNKSNENNDDSEGRHVPNLLT